MSIKFIKYIFMILFICTTALFVQTSSSYAAGNCDGAYQPTDSEKDSGTTPNASGMFSDEIMKGMQEFMQRIYLHLSKPLMIGHSLMCYADKVAYHKIGYGEISITFFNMNLFISGLLIYFVGVMMAMSIGMYFVDISFKLGFAMLFMPISIALWPFPPTKNKFQENLSIVIKNGMLFTLVAIGVAFAVTLISGSLFDEKYGSNGEKVFWDAIANKQTELLIESFAFDEFHFLVVAFGLIFAFKILASSVNDYLNYFFSDSVFGSESPMHHMGTQAIGMIKANTVDKAASFAKDVAKTQTGRALAGLGGGIAKLGSAKGRGELAQSIKNKASTVKRVVTNPRQTYNNAMQKAGDGAEKVVSGVGSGVKGLVNAATFVLPIKESARKKTEKWLDDKIDKGTQKIGQTVGDTIAHGGGKLQNLAADTAAFGANTYNQMTGNKNAKFVTRDDVKDAINESIDSVKDDLKTLKKNGLKENAKQGMVKAATMAHNLKEMANGTPENMISEDDMREELHDIKEDINDKYIDPIRTTAKIYAEPITSQLQKGAKIVQGGVNTFNQNAHDLKVGAKEKWEILSKEADKAPVTLQPSAIISAPFKAVFHPQVTGRKLADGWDGIKKAKEDKVILKKTGQIILRSVKGTGQDAKKVAEGTASIFGNMLKDFGNSMQQNGSNKNKGWTSWQKMHEAEERKKAAAQEDRAYFSSIDKDNDE